MRFANDVYLAGCDQRKIWPQLIHFLRDEAIKMRTDNERVCEAIDDAIVQHMHSKL